MIKLSTPILLQLNKFLNDLRLRKCVIKSFFDNLFKSELCHDRCKAQGICNRAVDNFRPALNLFPIGLFQVK